MSQSRPSCHSDQYHRLVCFISGASSYILLDQANVLPGSVFSVRYTLSPMKQLSSKLLSVSLACWSNKQLSINQNTTERTRMFTHTGNKEALFNARSQNCGNGYWLRHVSLSARRNNLASTGRIFMKFYI
jgi:hypothetical protein